MIKQKLALISIAVAFAISGPAVMAKGKPEHAQKKSEKVVKKAEKERTRYFDDGDRRIIRDYYDGRYDDRSHRDAGGADLPPGLQKKYQRTGQLPPGWAKKLNRGDVLPIDIYRHGHELPYDLRRRLPIGPVGSKVLEIEGKIIRVMQNTREIVDILEL